MQVQESFTLGRAGFMPANLLEDMLLLVKNHVPVNLDTQELLFKSKFILTELLTNAIKHANSSEVKLDIAINDNQVSFVKTDNGNPLTLPQRQDESFKNATIVAADIMHTLYAIEKDGNQYFYCHENTVPELNIARDFPEHFGLLIITKAADEFYYNYDKQSGINTFTATINL